MSDDLEQRLQGIRPAPPSAELDRRMDAIFATAVTSEKTTVFPWWVALPAAGVVAAGILFWRQPEPLARPQPLAPIVYRIEPEGLMREWLLTPPAGSQTAPAMIVTVQ